MSWHHVPCACGRRKDSKARHCLHCYRETRRAWKLPMPYLTAEEQRYRRAKQRANYEKYRPSPAWAEMVRHEKALARGFRCGMELAELYARWMDWKTAERLHWLQDDHTEGQWANGNG